jgi:hypothetical protein
VTIVNSTFILPTGAELSSGTITYSMPDLRRSAGGSAIVTPDDIDVAVVDGVAAAEDLEPGPYEVRVAAGWFLNTYQIVVPETGPAELMDLIEEFVTYEPQVVGQVQQLVAQAQGLSTAQDEAVADLVAPGTATKTALDATYAPAFADTGITYNPDDSVATVTENGVTTSYTYNPDGTVATDTRDGVTRQYTYTDGNLTGIEAV